MSPTEGMQDEMRTEMPDHCTLCPRECGADRRAGKTGVCGVPGELQIARAALHMWEEPCISGEEGSGAVFFSGCPLGCIFCQNHEISTGHAGKRISVERLAEIFLELQEKRANNINLVTAGHYAPLVRQALILAKRQGLMVPVVYNSSGYEKTETLQMLKGLIDIYLPDFKYMDPAQAGKYSHAPDYPDRAKEALKEMVRQVGEPRFDERGMMKKGVIVRHLLLPGCLMDSKRILRYLYETYQDQIYLSIMSQYTPVPRVLEDPLLGRKVRKRSYESLLNYAIGLGVENAFFQEGETAEESFIPAFDCEGV